MALSSENRTVTSHAGEHVLIDEGLRQYMLRVYNYMASGLTLTGLVAWVTAQMSVVTNASGQIVGLTGLGETMFTSPLSWVIMLAPLGFVFFLSARIGTLSLSGAQTAFWLFAGVMGLSMASIFLVFTGESITRIFFIAAGIFASMSLYGYTTKKDISGWGSFLFMGLIGVIIASIVNIFVGSTLMHFAISAIGVLVFTGLTAYDTQSIKEMYTQSDGTAVAGKKALLGALRLYLDFINLFIMLLHLFGGRR
ncbi:MAG: Bax inhibitor-1/YccA family protein [Alphaproteobacteria bacterium]|nr:Bax inhibitor-1/YccA family protein [Alphaproteobacteria bacterium]